AGFFENITHGGIGLTPRHSAWARWGATPLPIKEVLDWQGEFHDGDVRYHLWSWLLYHWLWSRRNAQFTRFQQRLAADADPALAWSVAFPEFDPADPQAMKGLEKELRGYRAGDVPAYRVTAVSDGAFSESPLSSADVHML